jgi:hypothetical protein
MKIPTLPVALIMAFFATFTFAAETYSIGPDSKPQPGVPQGEVLKFTLPNSKVFPGTQHDYSVYVPAEYTGDKPACVYVGQDGVNFDAPAVFDNLIYKKEMPVTIGVFVKPGVVPAAGTNALDRYRSATRPDACSASCPRPTAASRISALAGRSSTRCLRPVATRCSNAN